MWSYKAPSVPGLSPYMIADMLEAQWGQHLHEWAYPGWNYPTDREKQIDAAMAEWLMMIDKVLWSDEDE